MVACLLARDHAQDISRTACISLMILSSHAHGYHVYMLHSRLTSMIDSPAGRLCTFLVKPCYMPQLSSRRWLPVETV
jgi:hypothetical protein